MRISFLLLAVNHREVVAFVEALCCSSMGRKICEYSVRSMETPACLCMYVVSLIEARLHPLWSPGSFSANEFPITLVAISSIGLLRISVLCKAFLLT